MRILVKTNKNLSTQLLWKNVANFCVCSIVQGATRACNTKTESPYNDHYPCLAIMVCHFVVVLCIIVTCSSNHIPGNYKYVMSTNIIRKKYIRNHN